MRKPLILYLPTTLLIVLLLSSCSQQTSTDADDNGEPDVFASPTSEIDQQELVESIAEPITTITAKVLLCLIDPDSCNNFSLNFEEIGCQEANQGESYIKCCIAMGTLDITLQTMQFDPDDLEELHSAIRSHLEEQGIPSLPEDIEWMQDESLKLATAFIEKQLPKLIVQAPFVDEQCTEEVKEPIPKVIVQQRVRNYYTDLFLQCYEQPNCLGTLQSTLVPTEITSPDDEWLSTPSAQICWKIDCTYTSSLPICTWNYVC